MRADGKRVAAQFGKTLRTRRLEIGMSQETLGKRASLHRTEVGLLEKGERMAQIDTLVKLSSALSVKPKALLEGIEWKLDGRGRGRFDLADLDDAPRARGS